jgi:hypothetical protein
MIDYLFNVFSKPAVAGIIEKEIYETKVALLTAQSSLEYYTAMVSYNKAKLLRLESTKS